MYITPHFFIYKFEEYINVNDFLMFVNIHKNFAYYQSMEFKEDFDFSALQTDYIPYDNCLNNSELKARKEIFKNILFELTNFHHDEFLQRNNILTVFDPIKAKTWHHQFNLDTIQDIPMFSLQISNFPNSKKTNTTTEFIIKNNVQLLIQKELQNISASEDITQIQNVGGLSSNLINQVIIYRCLLFYR